MGVVSQSDLATAMIVPAFIATKVAAENPEDGASLIVQTIITMLTITEWL